MKLTFGKYKGRSIKQMTSRDETQYLHWLMNSRIKLNDSLKQTIKSHLK